MTIINSHKNEIIKLKNKCNQKGLTLVPTKIYFNNNHIKLEIALAKGKKLYDKRQTLKEKVVKRDLERAQIQG